MADIQFEKKDGKAAVLRLSGDMTINSIHALHGTICEIMDDVDSLTLDLSNAQIDMTFIQMTCSAHRAFEHSGKQFAVNGCRGDFFKRTDSLGYTRHKGCIHDKNKSCVLVREG